MNATIQLPSDTEAFLRARFSEPSETEWVVKLAAREGWLRANRSYLGSMYQRGVEEMTALIGAAGLFHQPTVDEALQLLETALSLWAPGTSIKRLRSAHGEACVEVRVVNCPTYQRIESAGWRGVTACGNWHHRQGWYDALGIQAEDTLMREKKWGYGACVVRVRLRAAGPAAGPVPVSLRARPLPRPAGLGPRIWQANGA